MLRVILEVGAVIDFKENQLQTLSVLLESKKNNKNKPQISKNKMLNLQVKIVINIRKRNKMNQYNIKDRLLHYKIVIKIN